MDTDIDGKYDMLNFGIDFSSQHLNITSVQLLLFFRVSLSVSIIIGNRAEELLSMVLLTTLYMYMYISIEDVGITAPKSMKRVQSICCKTGNDGMQQ